MKKIIFILISVYFFSYFSGVFYAEALAPKGTILPETSVQLTVDCQRIMIEVRNSAAEVKENVFVKRLVHKFSSYNNENLNQADILGCGIKTGDIPLWMIPFYARYILEFIIGIAGIIAVLGIVYGGYLYLVSGLSDNVEKAKNAIIYGLAGFGITLIAWAFVSVFIAFLSG